MLRLTTEQFIEKARIKHGDKYDYSLVEYKNCDTKVKIICPKHGLFEQTPYSHSKGSECPKCATEAAAEAKRKNLSDIIKEFPDIDFSLVDKYENNSQKLKLICKTCKNIFYRPYQDLRRERGCSYCSKGCFTNSEIFKWKARLKHGDKYDYSLVEYKSARTKVKIKCNTCGYIFEQTPDSHLYGEGCSKCSNNCKLTAEEFIERAKEIHGDKYNYSLVDYKNAKTKVKIICPKHGVFEQVPDSHLREDGCPICNSSSLEERTYNDLIKKGLKEGIDFIMYKKFDDFVDIRQLSYDFYLIKENILIECNGIQHYKFTPYFHKTLHDFHKQLHHDWLKRKYAREHNIELIIIK